MSAETFVCEQCLKETPRAAKTQRFCRKCRLARDKASSRKSALAAYRKHKEEKRQVQTTVETFKLCEKCKRIISAAYGRKYCPDCAKEVRLAQMREQREKGKFKKPKAEAKRDTRPRWSGALFNLDGKSLAEVNLEARALSMSYGKYVSACFNGTIVAELAAQGIERDKADRLITEARGKNYATKKRRAG